MIVAIVALRGVISLIGLIYAGLLFHRSMEDLTWLSLNKVNGIREYSAKSSVYVFSGGIVTQAAFFITSIISVVNYLDHHRKTTELVFYTNSIVFIIASAVGTWLAYIIYRRRAELLGMLDERKDS